ncbi:hypothetical protein BDN72DRAFT_767991, partial [Pluteus cervinus]
YQHYPYSHYPQSAYTHYPAYASALAQQSSLVARPPVTAVAAPTAQPAASTSHAGGVDTADIATLNDALGSAGVDLRAEEETLQRTHEQQQTYRSYEDRSRKQPLTPSFDTRYLGPTMRQVGTQHSVTKVPEDAVNYMALALRARLQDLVTAMITASHHRTDTQFDRPATLYEDGSPMWSIVVRSDVAKQLAALEKVEREEEMKVRRERKERLDMAAAHAAALAAQANGAAASGSMAGDGMGMDDGEGGAKKKRKKEGPGVTARNMSEDVRKKMSNAVATQAAGLGGKYSWMTAANAAAAATPKGKAAAAATATTAAAGTSTAATTSSALAPATTTTPAVTGSSWARPYVPTKKTSQTPAPAAVEEDTRTSITLRDALFVIEKERGHGGGKGAAKGWV